MQWGRNYMVCHNQACTNWIWQDKLRPGTRCRKCGQWWDHYATTGKGKGQGHGQAKPLGHGKAWPKKSPGTQLLDSPPGLYRPRPLKQNKDQAAAAELLATTWEVIPEGIQAKLMALGFGPPPPEEPELTELLKTHMTALPQEVQAVVTKLTQPLPDTEKDLAQKLKAQVGDLKSVSIKKTQLQTKLDQVKTQYASMLQDMQELQGKLNEGQQRLKQLSDQYMKITTLTPQPTGLEPAEPKDLPIPMAVETFVTSLGIDLSDEQRSQLHGLLKRTKADEDEVNKRRKTDTEGPPTGGQCG